LTIFLRALFFPTKPRSARPKQATSNKHRAQLLRGNTAAAAQQQSSSSRKKKEKKPICFAQRCSARCREAARGAR
jgi:hypothetical protein